MANPIFVGIDVAKAQLDIAVRPGPAHWTAPNDEAGIAALVGRLVALPPTLVVLEATGGLEVPVVAALVAAGVPVAVVNPRQVRRFAQAVGQLAKTDVLDAQLLAHFAEAMRPTPRPVPAAAAQQLRALLARRQQVVAMLTAERQRFQTVLPAVQVRIRSHIHQPPAGHSCALPARAARPGSAVPAAAPPPDRNDGQSVPAADPMPPHSARGRLPPPHHPANTSPP